MSNAIIIIDWTILLKSSFPGLKEGNHPIVFLHILLLPSPHHKQFSTWSLCDVHTSLPGDIYSGNGVEEFSALSAEGKQPLMTKMYS